MEPTLTIIVRSTGAVEVNGPVDNKMLCYSMLEMARDAIKDHHDQQAKSPIIRPALGLMPHG